MMDDIDRIMEIMATAFDPHWGEAWTRRQISDSLQLPTIFYDLVGPDGTSPAEGEMAAGFTLIRAIRGEEEVLLIAVRPDQRGKGLGHKLLSRFIGNARDRGAERVYLEMRSNNPAENLYRAFGFLPIGRRKEYYSLKDGSRLDAITFEKPL